MRYLHEEIPAQVHADQNEEMESTSLRSTASVESDDGIPLMKVEIRDEDLVRRQQKSGKRKNKNEGSRSGLEVKMLKLMRG